MAFISSSKDRKLIFLRWIALSASCMPVSFACVCCWYLSYKMEHAQLFECKLTYCPDCRESKNSPFDFLRKVVVLQINRLVKRGEKF